MVLPATFAVNGPHPPRCKTHSDFKLCRFQAMKNWNSWKARLFGRGAASLLFHHTLQRMLMLARKIHHLRHFRFGNLVGENAALADAMMMDVQHDLGGSLDV